MKVLVSPSVRSVNFMMYLMKLVKIRQMEQLMSPKCEKIFNIVDNEDYLEKDLTELWEIVKA